MLPLPARAALVAASAALAVLAACGGGGGGSNTPTAPALVPTTMASANGTLSMAGCGGALVPDTPVVVVRDQNGGLVRGATVTFNVTGGGGSLSKTTVTTNNFGQAGTAWTLGASGTQTLSATAGAATATFTAALTSTGPFCVELIYTAPPDPVARVAAEIAAARWSTIINGSIGNYVVNDPSYNCAGVTVPALSRTIKSVLIYVELAPIPSTTPGLITLGQAGPCSIRDIGGLTGVGVLRLNSDYLVNNLSQAQREDVVLHEMGHVLGIGTLWEPITGVTGMATLLVNPAPTGNPTFVGSNTVARYVTAGATGATQVPVENCGGGGTINGHWREADGGSVATVGLGKELMTGFISAPAGQHNPLSAITIASLQDMGYPVSYATADAYFAAGQTCPATLVGVASLQIPGLVRVGNDLVVEEIQKPLRVGGRGISRPIFR